LQCIYVTAPRAVRRPRGAGARTGAPRAPGREGTARSDASPSTLPPHRATRPARAPHRNAPHRASPQAAAFAPAPAKATPRAAPLYAVGLYYSTTTGNTETVAGYLTAATGIEAVDIDSVDDETLAGLDALICGAPTWHTGADEQRSGTAWDEFLYDRLPSLDLSGKKVAIFGLGDQGSYGDNFCDAAGELYDCFTAVGAEIVGATSPDDYDHSDSKALRDGQFCGLLCDEDNEYDKSEGRVNAWVEQLKGEGVAL
jgi:flavodoxin I